MVKPPEEINPFQILTNEDWIWFQNYMYIFVMYNVHVASVYVYWEMAKS